MQSANYVPGVSGWKITDEMFEINHSPGVTIRLGCLDRSEVSGSDGQLKESRSSAQGVAKSFIVVGGVTYINQALVEDFRISARITEEASARASADEAIAGRTGALEAAITDWKPRCAPGRFTLTLAQNSSGHYVATGIGVGIDQGRDDKQVGVDEALSMLCSKIGETDLGRELRAKIDAVESVREVIRKELRPGGLLHRR
ncbi:MAG: hypothetical protein PBV00_07035 [Pseudomonas asiatica]